MLVIRPLTIADAEDFRSIRLSALRDSPDAFGSDHETESRRPVADFEQRLTASTILGAFDGSKIVGLVRFDAEVGLKERHKGTLGGMYVDPAERRRGVGVALVQAVVDLASGVVEQLKLTVVQGNGPAIALYERFDFKVYGVEPRSLKDTSGYSDEILMVKFL